MAFRVIEVADGRTERLFLDCPRRLYANDPQWVCPLDLEIRAIFDRRKNPLFARGEACRWVLLDGAGQPAGRIAAFIDAKRAARFEQPTGGIGFFESVIDPVAAGQLFDVARDWLAARGMEAMDGPINFGENDRYWGLLVEGFTQPVYGMPYNPPAYRELFEGYGFETYFRQQARVLDLTQPPPERFRKIGQWVHNKEGVHFECLRRAQIERFGRDFLTIYNDAWQHHPQFVPMTEAQLAAMLGQLRQVLVEELCIFAYVRGVPAGFLIALPDLNQLFKPYRGRLGVWGTLAFLWRRRGQFAWYRRHGVLTRARVVILGVRPSFQRYGLEAGMTILTYGDVQAMGFREVQLSWVGDFNPVMESTLEATGAAMGPRYITYRKLFAEGKKVQVAPAIRRS
jgi:hypothetical protein